MNRTYAIADPAEAADPEYAQGLREAVSASLEYGFFIVQEGGAASLQEPWLKRLLREQAAMFDRFLAAVGEEHARESETFRVSSEQRKAERIGRLLAGELVDASVLGYAFEGWHLGLIAQGPEAEESTRALAASLDCRLLIARHDEETVWAWIGGRRPAD